MLQIISFFDTPACRWCKIFTRFFRNIFMIFFDIFEFILNFLKFFFRFFIEFFFNLYIFLDKILKIKFSSNSKKMWKIHEIFFPSFSQFSKKEGKYSFWRQNWIYSRAKIVLNCFAGNGEGKKISPWKAIIMINVKCFSRHKSYPTCCMFQSHKIFFFLLLHDFFSGLFYSVGLEKMWEI